MDYLLVGFVVWIALMSVRGGVRGFWPSFAGCAAIVGAYLLGLFLFPSVLSFAEMQEWRGYQRILPLIVVFVGIYTFIYFGISFVGSFLPLPFVLNSVGGGLVSAAYAAVSAFIALWGFGFALSASRLPDDASVNQIYQSSAITPVANEFVASAINWGAVQWGVAENKAAVFGDLAKHPELLTKDIREMSNSPETQAFIRNAEVRDMLSRRDVDALLDSAAYHDFVRQPEVQSLSRLIHPDGAASERELASSVAAAWSTLESVQQDEKLQQVLADPEIQLAIKNQDSFSLMTNPKAQVLIDVLLERLHQNDLYQNDPHQNDPYQKNEAPIEE